MGITGAECALKGHCGIPRPFSSSFLLSEHGLSTFALPNKQEATLVMDEGLHN